MKVLGKFKVFSSSHLHINIITIVYWKLKYESPQNRLMRCVVILLFNLLNIECNPEIALKVLRTMYTYVYIAWNVLLPNFLGHILLGSDYRLSCLLFQFRRNISKWLSLALLRWSSVVMFYTDRNPSGILWVLTLNHCEVILSSWVIFTLLGLSMQNCIVFPFLPHFDYYQKFFI